MKKLASAGKSFCAVGAHNATWLEGYKTAFSLTQYLCKYLEVIRRKFCQIFPLFRKTL
jgi:hypothetical protein